MPTFIGHHVGKGYGQIKKDNRPPQKRKIEESKKTKIIMEVE
jgi:hypothetical protein